MRQFSGWWSLFGLSDTGMSEEVSLMSLPLAIALLSLFLCGVGIGMNVWALAFALKRGEIGESESKK